MMESMGMANWFGELMSSYAGMVKYEREVHDAEELLDEEILPLG